MAALFSFYYFYVIILCRWEIARKEGQKYV